jgi:tetratricopeptide (TPR) repeat protein
LRHLDVIEDENRLDMVILTANGTEKRAMFESAKWQMSFHWSWNKTSVPTNLKTQSIFDDRLDKLPLYLKNIIPSRIPYVFSYLPEDRMLYFQYNAVNNWRNDPFTDFTQRMFKTFDDNVSKIDKFVIDLRFNEGGNGYLLPPLVKEFVLREKSFGKGKLFIITGNHTFSAAPNLIGQMLQSTNAVTVGDIAAGSLNWCSDVMDFILPNSKVVVDISTMYWQRGHATDNRGYYPPDCYLPTTFKDYASCSDPVLDAIKNGTALSLKQIILDNGVNAFLAEVERRKNLYGNVEMWFPYTSVNLVLTAYFDLVANGKIDDALKLAKWNTVLYPNDFRAWYGLAEIANETEKIKEALDAYTKFFTIEPDISEAIGNYNRLILSDVCENKDPSEFEDAIEDMKKKDPLSVDEKMLNDIGYMLLGKSKIREAIKIFDLNVKLYPESANVYDSLGEAYLKADEKELARKNYEKALSLDPNSTTAKRALEELGKK